ncbi:MAG: radical SAM protein [Deltaproteobacteria bacterium]|jgi:hypothetical protein|nr:radical SAM protein [Deltaproteobacteria bacterium]MBW2537009.1 radical SAM protein [Deltaproteobacteria bacterium]
MDDALPPHPSEAVALSPYVGLLRDQVTSALQEWLGLGDDCSISWTDHAAETPFGELSVRVEAAGRTLQLVLREAEPEARWQDDGVQVTCRREGDQNPLGDPVSRRWLRALERRFTRAAPRGDSSRELRAALAAVRPFTRAAIADWMLRRAESTHEGAVGMLLLGHRCNQDCTICFQGRTWPSPPPAVVTQWLDEIAAAGIEMVVLTGGEPTVYGWLPELIARAAGRHRMKVLLQTNAVRLAKPSYLGRLLDAGLSSALVAFHSADGGVSDQLTRAPGTHRLTVEGIRNLLAARVETTLNCCVEATTVSGLDEHARFIVDQLLGARPSDVPCRVEYSEPGAYLDRERMLRSIMALDVVRPHLQAAVRRLRQANVPVRWSHPCGFPPCLLPGQRELEHWERRDHYGQAIADRRFAARCDDCAAKAYCVGLRPEYLMVHGERGLQPFASLPAAALGRGPAGARWRSR